MSQLFVPKGIALFSGVLIPCSFVVYVDWIKKIAASKIIKKKDDNDCDNINEILDYELRTKHSYREAELKFFLPYSFIYLLILLISFLIIGPYINFDLYEIYFSPKYSKSIREKFIGAAIVIIINFILYTGLLIQFILGNEKLLPKSSFCFFMENLYGPFLEEFIYRGILFTLFKQAEFNGIFSAVFSSLTFSVSHFRHVFDIYFDRSQIPHLFFQSFYTLLFGFYTCYAYNFSGTIFAPVILHGVCNTLQMPRVNYLKDSSLSKFKKNLISFSYIFGIVSWILLIKKYHLLININYHKYFYLNFKVIIFIKFLLK